jgi:hypothetical protein
MRLRAASSRRQSAGGGTTVRTHGHCSPNHVQTASTTGTDKRLEFQSLYQLLVDDETRNRAICEEVVQAVRDGRSPLVLTERNEHLDRFECAFGRRSSRRGPTRGNGLKAAGLSGGAAGSHSTGRRSRHPGDWQIHRRGIRRSALGHAVSDASGLMARDDCAVRWQAASPL